jgi:hypothetical protein
MDLQTILNRIDNLSDKFENFRYSDECTTCNNKHTCMCDCCSYYKINFGLKENHHTNYYLDINFEPKFLEHDFESNMKIKKR